VSTALLYENYQKIVLHVFENTRREKKRGNRWMTCICALVAGGELRDAALP
jgi:hypothetical protein